MNELPDSVEVSLDNLLFYTDTFGNMFDEV